MTGLEPLADQIVREAVDAHLDGHSTLEQEGELVFETKNSRYRLMDGILFSAPDSSLIGAELVGWLIDGRRPVVELTWQPNCRAVLVDRKRGRHIIVTSSTRMHQMDGVSHGSGVIQSGSISAPPSAPPPPASYRHEIAPPAMVTSIPRPPPIPSPLPLEASGARRAPLHLPPRPLAPLTPIAPRSLRDPGPTSSLPPPTPPPPRPIACSLLASLPYPSAPPRHPGKSGTMQAVPQGGYALPPVQAPPVRATGSWSTTSALAAQPAYYAPQPTVEEVEDLEVTEAQERPVPLVRPARIAANAHRTLLSAQSTAYGRGMQRGALLR